MSSESVEAGSNGASQKGWEMCIQTCSECAALCERAVSVWLAFPSVGEICPMRSFAPNVRGCVRFHGPVCHSGIENHTEIRRLVRRGVPHVSRNVPRTSAERLLLAMRGRLLTMRSISSGYGCLIQRSEKARRAPNSHQACTGDFKLRRRRSRSASNLRSTAGPYSRRSCYFVDIVRTTNPQ